MERSCVFCGNRPLTREHVFPQWLTNVLPDQERWRGQDSAVLYLRDQDRDAPPDVSREMGERFTATTVNRVCATCNHGWMERLESEVRPALTKLIVGEAFTFGSDASEALATWVAKTAMMAEFTHPESKATRPLDYRDLYETGRPPSDMFIWAAATDTVDWCVRMEHAGLLFGDPDEVDVDQPCNVHSTTIGLGKVVFSVLGGSPPELPFPKLQDIPPFGAVRLWPEPDIVQWSRNVVLDDWSVWLMSDLLRLSVQLDDEIIWRLGELAIRST